MTYTNWREDYPERAKESDARVAMAQALPAALTAADGGKVWTLAELRLHDEGYAAGEFYAATLKRESDGVQVWIARGPYNKPGRSEASILWKRDIDGGLPHGLPSTSVTFAIDRPAKAVARQILSGCLNSAAMARMGQIDAQNEAARRNRDAAAEWRAAVSEAAGIVPTVQDRGRDMIYWPWVNHWGKIISRPQWAGGQVEVKLPDDPIKAAVLVRAIRAAVEGLN